MEMSERIVVLMEKLGLNKSSFAAKIGVSQPIITHISTGRNNPSMEVIQKILLNCPDVNPEWLLLGRGEVLLNKKLREEVLKNTIKELKNSLIKVKLQIESLEETVTILENTIGGGTG